MSPVVCSHTKGVSAASSANHNRPTTGSGGVDWNSAGLRWQAYDTTSWNSVDTATATGPWTSSDSSLNFSAFEGTGSVSGTLHVRAGMMCYYGGSVNGPDPTASKWEYSTDGGSNWNAGGTLTNAVWTDQTVTLTSVTLSQLQIRFTTYGNSGGSLKLGTDYANTGQVNISDIVIL